MKAEPFISVCIPAYNIKPYIAECIESVLSQGFDRYEIVLVDNGSTDGTDDICRSYAEKHPDIIRYFELPRPTVIVRAHNYALEQSRGAYVWLVDGDDRIAPDALQILADTVEQNAPELVVMSWDSDWTNNRDIWSENFQRYTWRFLVSRRLIDWTVQVLNQNPVFAGLFMADALKSTCWMYLANSIAFAGILYYYRIRADGASQRSDDAFFYGYLEANEALREIARLVPDGQHFLMLNRPKIRAHERLAATKQVRFCEPPPEECYIYPAGRYNEYIVEQLLSENKKVLAFLDNDKKKHGTMQKGVPVCAPEAADKTKAVIISSAYEKVINECTRRATELGFSNVIQRMNTPTGKLRAEIGVFYINTVCTLKCKKCITFTPYQKNARNYPLEHIKRDIDAFFEIYEWVDHMDIEGGESLLHPDLLDIMKYAFEYHRERFGRFHILTNGTLLPKPELLEYAKTRDVFFIIDDYGVDLSKNKENLEHLLTENGIDYRVDIYNGQDQYYGGWIDFGDMQEKNYSDETLYDVFSHCRQATTKAPYIKDGKLFLCSIQASELAHIALQEGQYVDLVDDEPIERKIAIAQNFGVRPVNPCKYCNGFIVDGKRIPAAEQLTVITEDMKIAGSLLLK